MNVLCFVAVVERPMQIGKLPLLLRSPLAFIVVCLFMTFFFFARAHFLPPVR